MRLRLVDDGGVDAEVVRTEQREHGISDCLAILSGMKVVLHVDISPHEIPPKFEHVRADCMIL